MQSLPRPAPADPLLVWARYYASCGLAVIPVRAGTKVATVAWKHLQTRLPTDAELVHWFSTATHEEVGIALICGDVSGRVVCLDVDLQELADAARENLRDVLSQTWCDTSGSGKLHIFLRAQEEGVRSSVVNTVLGKRAMDVCANRHIAVLPPTRHHSGGTYGILWGGPELIQAHANPTQFGQRMYDAWAKVSVAPTDHDAPPDNANMTIDPPASAERIASIRSRLAPFSAKLRATVNQTEGWFEAYHRLDPSDTLELEQKRSEIQFYLFNILCNNGWHDVEEFVELFASFPCGNLTYNRRERSHHGRSMVERDFNKKMLELQRGVEAASDLDGMNFRIVSASQSGESENPQYRVRVFSWITQLSRTISLSREDLAQEKRMLLSVSSALRIVAKLTPALSGHGYESFRARFMQILIVNDAPDEVYPFGHLRSMIRIVLARGSSVTEFPNSDGDVPSNSGHFRLGWSDENYVYVRGNALIHELNMMLRPSPDVMKIWDAVADVGAEKHRCTYEGGKGESLWRIPKDQLEG